MKKDNLKNKTALVFDFGLFTELAVALKRTGFGRVLYFVPWQDDFPSSMKQKIGLDFDGLERIQNFDEWVDKADIIVSFDTYCGDKVNQWRKIGKRVWGAGSAETMELERWKMRRMQEAIGLPTQMSTRIKSLDDLVTYFQGVKNEIKDWFGKEDKDIAKKRLNYILGKYNNFSKDFLCGGNLRDVVSDLYNGARNKYVKANMRGDIESFFAPDYESSLSKFNSLAEKFGHRADSKEVEFIIEEMKTGVEPGFDGIQIDGNYLSPTIYGYERKGSGYIGRICKYEELPNPIRFLNEKLSIIFKKFRPTRCFFSNEFIVGADKKPYLIDPTVRNPAPVGSAIYSELIENLADIVWYGANGESVAPIMKYKYCAGVSFDSQWGEEHELEVEFPPELRRWVKMRKCYCKNGKYYAVPGFSSICSVIALGNSIDEVVNLVRSRAEKVKAYELQTETGGLDKVKEEIEKGKKFGINF